jgi:hypothetical protein
MDGMIILKLIVDKYVGRIWTGLICLSVRTDDEL